MFYCEVTDSMKTSDGGGVEDELIEVIEMTVEEVQEHIESDCLGSPGSFLAGVYYYLMYKHCE